VSISKARSAAFCVAAIAALFGRGEAFAQPTTVFVFNGTNTTGFDTAAQGYIFSQMGLLNENGKPPTRKAGTLDLENPVGVKVGEVITDNGQATGNVIGYKNLVGSVEAYDLNLNGATCDAAWQRVAPNGTLHLIKHGFSYDDGTTGGGLQVDLGKDYSGFQERNHAGGTGREHPVYDLTARNGANITFAINACYSDNDPDGVAGPLRSVTASAAEVPGVAATGGHTGVTTVVTGLELLGGTAADRSRAQLAMSLSAMFAGHFRFVSLTLPGRPNVVPVPLGGEVMDWISGLPFDMQYLQAQAAADAGAGAGVVTVRLDYEKNPTTCRPCTKAAGGALDRCEGYHAHPVGIGPQGGAVFYADPEMGRLTIPPGSLITRQVFAAEQVGDPPPPNSSAEKFASGAFEFHALDGANTLPSPATIALEYRSTFDGVESSLDIFRYNAEAGTWDVVVTGRVVNTSERTVSVLSAQLGLYAIMIDTTALPSLLTTNSLLFLLCQESKDQLVWDGCGIFDVASGLLSNLRLTGNFAGATCLSNGGTESQLIDPRVPAAGDGFYYLVRAEGGTWNDGTEAADRDLSVITCF